MWVKVQIAGVDTVALLDSGSQVSIISQKLVDKSWIKRSRSPFKLRAANGGEFGDGRMAHAPFTVAGVEYSWDFYVDGGLLTPCLIGMDFMERWDVVLFTGSRRVQIGLEPLSDEEIMGFREQKLNPLLPLVQAVGSKGRGRRHRRKPPADEIQVAKPEDKGVPTVWTYFVEVARPTRVPPFVAITVDTHLVKPGCSGQPLWADEDTEWLVTPDADRLVCRGLGGWPSLALLKGGQEDKEPPTLPVRVVNPTGRARKLKKGFKIGEAVSGGFELENKPTYQLHPSVVDFAKAHVPQFPEGFVETYHSQFGELPTRWE